jgi:predicted small lipoprotein YifL
MANVRLLVFVLLAFVAVGAAGCGSSEPAEIPPKGDVPLSKMGENGEIIPGVPTGIGQQAPAADEVGEY